MRAGEEVELQPRPVSVYRFEMLGSPRLEDHAVDIDVVVDCSSGTYIRALARDLVPLWEVRASGRSGDGRRSARSGGGVRELGEEPPPVVATETVVSRLMPTMTVDDDVASRCETGAESL